jgi:hypothetical protein
VVELPRRGWTPRSFWAAYNWNAQVAGKTTIADLYVGWAISGLRSEHGSSTGTVSELMRGH